MPEGQESINTREGKPTPKRVFVEVGTEIGPVPFIGARGFGANEIYIGIDKNSGDIHRAKDNVRDRLEMSPEKRAAKFFFLEADGTRLPILNKSVNEIFFGNILASPGVKAEDADKLIREAKRVLKEEGVIIIVGTITFMSEREIRDLAEKHGLLVDKYFNETSPDWAEKIAPYSVLAARDARRSAEEGRGWKDPRHFLVFLKEKSIEAKLTDFRAKMAGLKSMELKDEREKRVGRTVHFLADGGIEPSELGIAEMEIWSGVEDESITKADLTRCEAPLRETIVTAGTRTTKIRPGISQSRINFLKFVRNKGGYIIGRRELEKIRKEKQGG